MFDSGEELLKLCFDENKSISEVTLEQEIIDSETEKDIILEKMHKILDTMEESSNIGLTSEVETMGGLLDNEAMKINSYRKNGHSFSGDFLLSAIGRSFSVSQVNASMGRIVAAPTAGSSGILPGVLLASKEKFNFDRDRLILGLFTAAGVGEIIAKKATLSGAEGGCQAECGVAAAMAAASLVEMAGGTPAQALDAASFAITNIMGLVCDPVGGLVEYPCALRNVSGVYNAFLSADLALANVKSLIPFDEVVESMYEVGNLMPTSLKETSLGGLATTCTGLKFKK